MIEAVEAVKLFDVEAPKRIAAGQCVAAPALPGLYGFTVHVQLYYRESEIHDRVRATSLVGLLGGGRLLGSPPQVRVDELAEAAVKHGLYLARLMGGARVLD